MANSMDGFGDLLTAPERNHFFYGMLMGEAQFKKDVRYFNLKRSLINRFVLGAGVACGLKVELDTTVPGSLRVTRGAAIDWWGREIIVNEPKSFVPHAVTDDQGNPTGETLEDGKDVNICLAYAEAKTDLVPVLVADCDTPGNCAPSTVREGFRVLVRPATGGAAEPPACGDPFSQEPWGTPLPAALHNLIVERLSQGCPTPPDDPCVVLARVTLGKGNGISFAGRQVIYNNALLYELILCLAQRVLELEP
jgi:hypothetical protein